MSEITGAYCNLCSGERRHEILYIEKTEWGDEDKNDPFSMSGGDDYELLKCCGCESIKLRHKQWSSEDFDAEGNPDIRVSYYPPAVFRRKPKWLGDLSFFLPWSERCLVEILEEIYVAIQNNSRRLAAMGIRALFEYIMISKVADNGSFSKNMQEFEKQGFISQLQKQRVETILEVGHATIHRAYTPSSEDLTALIDITESLLESIYIHDALVERLKKRIPPRQS
jgi:hypothetical protein